MRPPRRLVALFGAISVAAAMLAVAVGSPAGAVVATPAGIQQPKADILVDAATGRVLIADNPHLALRTASTAKIMTALTAVERLPPTAIITACPNTNAIESEKIGFPPGTRWPIDQMLAALMMVSANDAAYAFACTIGHGSLDAFAKDLNDTAHQLGLKETHLNDPSGLDDTTSFQGGPTMSVYDLATAARNALTVPAIAKWAGMHEYSFNDPQGGPHHFVNHNKMLPGGGFGYIGANGFKTGFTQQAQHTLVATASRNGRQLIAVIMGAEDSGYYEAGSLFDRGFAMPADAKGTGESVPDVAVSAYAARAADRDAFAKLGSASGTAANTPVGPVVTVPASVPVFNAQPRAAAPSQQSASAATASASAHHSGGGGLFSMRNVAIALILLACVAAFVLRRRKVRKQRAQRLARKRQRAAAMRSGGLPVVDGRYRTGMRLGPPVESHVHVREG